MVISSLQILEHAWGWTRLELVIFHFDYKHFKMESTRKFSNFNFRRTKTLCQNNLKHIAFIFQGLKMELVFCSNTKEKFLMGERENECQISENHILHIKFSEVYLCFHNSCEIWHSFSWAPERNFLWCYYRRLITSLALEKCKKECNNL